MAFPDLKIEAFAATIFAPTPPGQAFGIARGKGILGGPIASAVDALGGDGTPNPAQPDGQTVGEALGTSGASAGTDALMASAAARYVESIRTRDLKTEPVTPDDLAALYTFQNYSKLGGPDKEMLAQQARLDALTSEADRIFANGTDTEIDNFLTQLSMGENQAALDALLTPAVEEDTGMAELLAAQEEQVRLSELEYERGALLDFLDVFPEQMRGEMLLGLMDSPDVREMFFPGMSQSGPAVPTQLKTPSQARTSLKKSGFGGR